MKESRDIRHYSIDEVARELNLSQKRIRDFEKEGFINPNRHERTNNRLFTQFDIDQLRRIHYLIKKRGFTVKSLKQLFRYAHCWEIFDCKEKIECLAYGNPHEPCWKLTNDCHCKKPCQTCVVYLMRFIDKEKLLAR
jgi:hypothetical protein